MLAKLIDQAGIRIDKIAEMLSVSPSLVTHWRSGFAKIPDDKLALLLDLCRRMGVEATAEQVREANGEPRRVEEKASAGALDRAMKKRKATLASVGDAVGVSREAVRLWLRDGPPLSRVPSLAAALGVAEGDLLGGPPRKPAMTRKAKR